MKKIFREIAIIILILIAVDFTITFVFKDFFYKKTNLRNFYQHADYSHDLIPNENDTRVWGYDSYRHLTDANSLRIGPCAPDSGVKITEKDIKRIFLIGDSFTEGLGVDYEKTFAGLMNCKYGSSGFRFYNLGTAGYSPIIYHRKLSHVISKIGAPDHVMIFLDIGDISDDIEAFEEKDGKVVRVIYDKRHTSKFGPYLARAKDVLSQHFSTVLIIRFIRKKIMDIFGIKEDRPNSVVEKYRYDDNARLLSVGLRNGRWTLDNDLFRTFGERGLKVASENLSKIVSICRNLGCDLTLAVHPWPDQIFEGDENSRQVTYWRRWSRENNVTFINLFPPFFRKDPAATIRENFISTDYHWSEGGHRTIFEALEKILPRTSIFTGGDPVSSFSVGPP